MTPVKATILSFCMLCAIAFWAIGIYSADAGAGNAVINGYGVVAQN